MFSAKENYEKSFREYDETINNPIKEHYRLMRKYQSLSYYDKMVDKWFTKRANRKSKIKLSLREIFEKLKDYVDCSDPDSSIPNIHHSFQTAESIRKDKMPEWFQLIGLLHDIGKIMVILDPSDSDGQSEKFQWGTSGDTWILGYPIPKGPKRGQKGIVYPELEYIKEIDPNIYDKCGISNVKWSWGHDEYLYRVLKDQSKFSNEALSIVRYHSAYLWHREGLYKELMNPCDEEILKMVQKFNHYDLYTKVNKPFTNEHLETLMKYYEKLFEKYIGSYLEF